GCPIVEQPQRSSAGVDSKFASGGLVPSRAIHENILHQRVKHLMHAGVDGNEWDLISVRITERDQAEVAAFVNRSHSGEGAAAVPVQRQVIGQDQVEHPALEAAEDWPVGSRPADLAGPIAGLELDAAGAK